LNKSRRQASQLLSPKPPFFYSSSRNCRLKSALKEPLPQIVILKRLTWSRCQIFHIQKGPLGETAKDSIFKKNRLERLSKIPYSKRIAWRGFQRLLFQKDTFENSSSRSGRKIIPSPAELRQNSGSSPEDLRKISLRRSADPGFLPALKPF
jgi:hypothetical protein